MKIIQKILRFLLGEDAASEERWANYYFEKWQAAQQSFAADGAKCVCPNCGTAHDPKLADGGQMQELPRH